MFIRGKLFCVTFAALVMMRAQGPPAAGGDASAALQNRPQLVTLNVVATDNHGNPVTDLTEDDFQIQDQGKRQEVLFFRSLSQHGPPLAPMSGGYSNRTEATARRAPTEPTVLLLDLLNADLSDRGSGYEGIGHTLERLESGENVYLYLLTADAKLYAVHGLPGTDAKADPDWTKQIRKRLDDAIRTVNRLKPQDERDPSIRIRQTYQLLGDLASQMAAAIPGRKNMIWITHGVPVNFVSITNERIDLTGQLRNLANYINRAGVALYSVDQGGPGSLRTGREGPGYQSMDTLQQLADITGGREFPGNNVESAVTAALASARGSYLILYDPAAANWDGKYHKVSLKCSRKGVRIQAQQGYMAARTTGVETLRAAYEGAAKNQTDLSGIGVSATVSPAKGGTGGLQLNLRIDASDVVLIHRGDHENGELAVGVMSVVGDHLEAVAPILMNLSLTKELYAAAMKEGIPFVSDKVVAEGVKKLRIVVLDLNSGDAGALTVPVPGAQ